MVSVDTYFSPEDYADVLGSDIQGTIQQKMLDILDSDDLEYLLVNGPLEFARSLGDTEGEAWLGKLPDKSQVLVDIFEETNAETNTRINGWFRGEDPERSDRMRQQEYKVYTGAKKIASSIVTDTRTQDALSSGLTYIPAEVFADRFNEFYDSRDQDNQEVSTSEARIMAEGVGMAIAAIAKGNVTPREITERSVMIAFTTALGVELKHDVLESVYGDLNPSEYFANNSNTLTSGVFWCLRQIADTNPFEARRTSYDLGVSRLEGLVAEASIDLVPNDYQTSLPDGSTDGHRSLSSNVRFVNGFLMDVVNARWGVLKIGPGTELGTDFDSGEQQEPASLEMVYSILAGCSIKPKIDISTVQSFIDENKRPLTSEKVPVETLRDEILAAFKTGRNRPQLAQALRVLQTVLQEAAERKIYQEETN